MQMQSQPQGKPPNKIMVGKEKSSPKAQASPLKTELTNQPQIK